MAGNLKGVSAEIFYGAKSAAQVRIEALLKKSNESSSSVRDPSFMTQLLGPSRTWKVFKKQQDAINFCLQRRNNLMCFAYEQKGGQRLFLVAHPKVFWAKNFRRFFKDCSTYEIIQEYAACKLYFDIEFTYEFNSEGHNGDAMLNNFLHIVNLHLHESYSLQCTMNDILDLDSSNEKKYSHHVIYQIPNVAFQDNYKVGNFVQGICNELKIAYEYRICGIKDEMDRLVAKYKLTEDNILELFVCDSKGKTRLFVDEGVYTKNRHFRILGSTKMDKNSPLVISKSNKYKPSQDDSLQVNIFLDSLITYFSTKITRILEFHGFEKDKFKKGTNSNQKKLLEIVEQHCPLYPEIDKFIQEIISPIGGIRRKSFFSSTSKLIYDIHGYRYCDNIKRHHKSNNIMFIIDLQNLTYYQKCHDSECAHFKSEAKKLPEEICFQLEDDSMFYNNAEEVQMGDLELSEHELIEILSCLEVFVNMPEF